MSRPRLRTIARLRKKYLASPGKRTLRAYLQARAKRGHYDVRFFRYYGPSPKVNAGCRAAATRAYAAGLVPTSTLRFPVGLGSYHNERNIKGEGQGIDFGLIESEIGTDKGRRRMVEFQRSEHWRHRNKKLRHDMIELIGPDNKAVVLRDRETDLIEGTPLETQHDTHVHESYRG